MYESNFSTEVSTVDKPIHNTEVGQGSFAFAVSIARLSNAKTNAHAYEKIDDVVSILLRSIGFIVKYTN